MEKNWYKHYEPGIQKEIDLSQYTSLVDLFQQSCQVAADKNAFYNLGQYITFQELETKSKAVAAYLINDLKLKKGDRVVIMMPNLLQYPILLYAILRAGLVVVNVNPLFTAYELNYLLKDSGANTIFILENFAHVLEEALKKNNTSMKNIIITRIGDLLSPLKRPIVNFVVKYIKKMVPAYNLSNVTFFLDILKKSTDQEFTVAPITQEDMAFLQYTGGTTGVPRGAILTHGNILANMLQLMEWTRNQLVKGNEVVITPLPLYHIFSMTVNGLLFIALQSLNVLITNPRDIHHFIKELKNFKFTAMSGVNTLFNALLQDKSLQDVDFSHTRFALAGGVALQESVAKRWHDTTGCQLIEGYGLTETSPVVTANPLNSKGFKGSIGLPLPSTDVCILGEDDKELGIDEVGEFCVKGPQVTQGYWNSPEDTDKAFTRDGWFRTGDIAKIDAEGYVYIVDRKKDMINVSGFNVYPNEVESVIASHPGVREVGVIGEREKSEESGEVVKAVVVRKDPNLTKDDIIKHCRERITRYKVPKIIVFTDELPKTPVGKILRRKLREA